MPVPGDFNCNGKTDLVVFRESSFEWVFRFGANKVKTLKWKPEEIDDEKVYPLTADYDGDGCSDLAYFVLREGLPGKWFILPSGFSEKALKETYPRGHNIVISKSFGREEDLPAQVLLGFHHGRLLR